jgi:nicotinamide-nucleotide amidase
MQKNINIALLATGDELTQGSVLNTNAQTIAQELFSHGLDPNWHMTVSDDVADIEAALELLWQKHDVIITMGGLGPTSDDKTRFALASFLKETLVVHEPSLVTLQERYKQFNLPFTELSRQQTLFPESAIILNNTQGSANGCLCHLTKEGKWIFMLPGPPRECLPLFRDEVLPRLTPLLTTKKILLQWKVFGIAEGVIAEKVDNALKPYASICRTSFRWNYPYVDCKVLLDENAPEKDAIAHILNPVLSPYQLDPQNQTATERLKNALIQSKKRIFIQDDATGGILESLIHVPANHHAVFFGCIPQEPEIFFHIEGLKNYWAGETGMESELVLTSKKGTEKFTIPFRSALLGVYAAEFIANQIFLRLAD